MRFSLLMQPHHDSGRSGTAKCTGRCVARHCGYQQELIRGRRGVICVVCPAKVTRDGERGWIVPIGGAEERLQDGAILRRFVELAGGGDARVVVIPTASRRPEAGKEYDTLFRAMGVASVTVLRLDRRADADDGAALASLAEATGVFLTGGDQLRLSTLLGGTPVARLLRRRNAAGATIAGTSAGAAFLAEHMIARGLEGPSPRADMVSLAPGLGLTNRFVIDQHFRQRDRLGRLLTALAYNPFAIGIGLDEDTAAFYGPDDRLEVVGSGAITIVDPAGLAHSSMAAASAGEPVTLIGIKLHILVNGDLFDAETREARPGASTA
jgi:cyanophycinase